MYALSTIPELNSKNAFEIYRSMSSYDMKGPFELLQINTMQSSSDGAFCMFQTKATHSFYGIYTVEDLNKTPVSDNYNRANSSEPFLHSHSYYEFLFVLDGEIYQNIENHRHFYPAGGCCLVCPDTLHLEEYNTKSRVIFLKISVDYFNEILNENRYFATENSIELDRVRNLRNWTQGYIDFIPKNGYEWIKENIYSLLENMIYEFISPSASASFEIALIINKLLIELFDTEKFNNAPVAYGSKNERELFHKIRDYMIKSSGKVSRSELENKLNFTGDYLYKIVKNQTGLSLYDYNIQICLKKACNLLLTTDIRINDIAERIGFNNYTHFYKVFEKYYGMTPREFRKKS